MKTLIRRLGGIDTPIIEKTKTNARPIWAERVQMIRKPLDKPTNADQIVRCDLLTCAARAETYRERRQVAGVLRAAGETARA